jgi:hypothetical protein
MTCVFSRVRSSATWTLPARGVTFLVLALSAPAAFAVDELFPEAEKIKVTVHHKQDGRAVRGLITNESSLVASSIEVVCRHSAPQKNCGEVKGKGITFTGPYASLITGPDMSPCYISLASEEMVVSKQITLSPGKSTNFYAEIPDGQKVSSCDVQEVRGREKRWFNF